MKYFKFRISSEHNQTLDKILSGLLPHDNFSLDEAKLIIEELLRTLPVEETYGIYYIFLTLLKRLSILRLYTSGCATVLRRDLFEGALQSNLDGVMISPEFDCESFFKDYDVTFNLDVEKERFEAASFIFTEIMNKYDELFDLAIPSAEGLTWITVLKQGMEFDITSKMLSSAGQALMSGIKCDRDSYRGPADARKYLAMALTDVNTRIADTFCDTTSRFTPETITSYNNSKQYDERHKTAVHELYSTGFDPIDDVIHIRTQDIWNIVADEGIGKTRIALDQAYKALMSGINVLYVCGETASFKIKKLIEGAHLFSKYGLQLSFAELQDPSKLAVDSLDKLEDITTKINAACSDLYENENYGKLTIVQSCAYETFLDDIKRFHDAAAFELVIIDHVLALTSTGQMTSLGRLNTKQLRVSYLFECEDILVKECNIAFINTTHPSSSASEDLKAGRRPGARSGAESSDSSKYASLITILYNDDNMKNQDMVMLWVTKIRDDHPITEPLVLRRKGYSNIHEYDPKIQYLAQGKADPIGAADIATLLGVDEEM